MTKKWLKAAAPQSKADVSLAYWFHRWNSLWGIRNVCGRGCCPNSGSVLWWLVSAWLRSTIYPGWSFYSHHTGWKCQTVDNKQAPSRHEGWGVFDVCPWKRLFSTLMTVFLCCFPASHYDIISSDTKIIITSWMAIGRFGWKGCSKPPALTACSPCWR